MTDSFASPLRLPDPAAIVGKTVARVSAGVNDHWVMLVFDDGTFLYVEGVNGWGDEGEIKFGGAIDMADAHQAGLIDAGQLRAWQIANRDARKAEEEAADRATFERLKAKFGEA